MKKLAGLLIIVLLVTSCHSAAKASIEHADWPSFATVQACSEQAQLIVVAKAIKSEEKKTYTFPKGLSLEFEHMSFKVEEVLKGSWDLKKDLIIKMESNESTF